MKTIHLLTYLFLTGLLLQGCNSTNFEDILKNQTGTFIAGASPVADGSGLIFVTADTIYGITGSPEDYSQYFPENENSVEIIADVKLTGETAVRESIANDQLMPVFEATVQAVEEAIINAMVAAETREGINENKVYALPHDLLINLCGSKVLGVKYILNQSKYESIMADTTCYRS